MLELFLLPFLISGAVLLARFRQRPPERVCFSTVIKMREDKEPDFTDLEFAEDAAQSAIYGLLLGTLGIEKSGNPEIRRLAEKMVLTNQMIILELTAVVDRNGLQVTKTLRLAQNRTIQLLSGLSGSAFELRFLAEATAEYRKKVRAFEREAEKGSDGELRRFASGTLPKVKSNLKVSASFARAGAAE